MNDNNIREQTIILLNNLIANGKYQLFKFDYYEGCFGNAVIILISNTRANIEVIRDRGFNVCYIGLGKSTDDNWELIDEIYYAYFGTSTL